MSAARPAASGHQGVPGNNVRVWVKGLTGQTIGLVWPVGSITAERDPEEYARAIEFLGDLCTWFAQESDERKEIVVLVPR